MQADRVLETCLYVDDLDAAERFYRQIVGLEFVTKQPGRHLFLRCGASMVLLFMAEESGRAGSELPPHGAHGPGHVAFAAADAQIDAWTTHLEKHQVAIEKIVHWPQSGRSLYFRDPSGNSLEIASPRIWGLDE